MSAASIIVLVVFGGMGFLVTREIIHAIAVSNQGPWHWCKGCGFYWSEHGKRLSEMPDAQRVTNEPCQECLKAGRIAK